MVNTFLGQVAKSFASRFVFSFNLYPYFDTSNHFLSPADAIKRDTCFKDDSCLFASLTKTFRTRMQQLMGRDATLWIAETGWSSPTASTLPKPMKDWANFSGPAAFKTT